MSWKDHPLHCDCVECSASASAYAGKRGAARGLIERLAHRGVSFEVAKGEAGDKVRLYPKGAVVGEDLDEKGGAA